MKIYTLTNNDYSCGDGCYIDWFKCPCCDDPNIVIDSHYCPNCGIKLEWNIDKNKLNG